MLKFSVCKTVVPYGKKEWYVLLAKDGLLGRFLTLEDLVERLRSEVGGLTKPVVIKNEAPGDIIWRPMTATISSISEMAKVPDEAFLYQRLRTREMELLAALLRR